jgi:hypothetical protein
MTGMASSRGRPAAPAAHAGVDREDIEKASDGQNPQHLLLRRGQQQVTPGAPGVLTGKHQRCQAAGVDKFQTRQIDDGLALAGGDRRERSRDTRGVCQVKLPAQRDDNPTVTFSGTQVHADHGGAFLLQQQGGVWTQRQVRQLPPWTLRLMPAAVPSGRCPASLQCQAAQPACLNCAPTSRPNRCGRHREPHPGNSREGSIATEPSLAPGSIPLAGTGHGSYAVAHLMTVRMTCGGLPGGRGAAGQLVPAASRRGLGAGPSPFGLICA